MLFRLLVAFLILMLKASQPYDLLIASSDSVIVESNDYTSDNSDTSDGSFGGMEVTDDIVIELEEDMSYVIE